MSHTGAFLDVEGGSRSEAAAAVAAAEDNGPATGECGGPGEGDSSVLGDDAMMRASADQCGEWSVEVRETDGDVAPLPPLLAPPPVRPPPPPPGDSMLRLLDDARRDPGAEMGRAMVGPPEPPPAPPKPEPLARLSRAVAASSGASANVGMTTPLAVVAVRLGVASENMVAALTGGTAAAVSAALSASRLHGFRA